ncbi:dynein axonemal assembly factor 3 homolog [Microplitis mediator]|uniref:dynein axonemal assembly factor 3 homolog n=1 Tax=Microplitis mediator TaxID=375433 RepID=UPI002553E05D|nr:dynein axonemal assembly factor 3 homolog [Microplitis mediator]
MWGHSPPLDFQNENYIKKNSDDNEPLEILTVGSKDPRHIIKTLASSSVNPRQFINFHVVESSLEPIARSILLLHICLQKDLGLQVASRYYLEVLGNTLLTPATAKYLTKTIYQLISVITQTTPCPWISIETLKYKDKDLIEAIFKFWVRAICEGVPVVKYWDQRIRKLLGTRYDYRDGAFDWDFHMILKEKNIPHLTAQEYRFWRNNGIAFTWLETEPARSNPTLISNVTPYKQGFIHSAYAGDITNGPYLTFDAEEADDKKKLRATDAAEGQIIKLFYQIRMQELCPDDIIAAHRDKSVLNGTLVTEMPDIDIEQESWVVKKSDKSEFSSWIDVPQAKVIYHSASSFIKYKNKREWLDKFDVVFVAHNMINHLENIKPLMKENGVLIVESRRFLVEARKKELEEFANELKKIADEIGIKLLEPFNPNDDNFARFVLY